MAVLIGLSALCFYFYKNRKTKYELTEYLNSVKIGKQIDESILNQTERELNAYIPLSNNPMIENLVDSLFKTYRKFTYLQNRYSDISYLDSVKANFPQNAKDEIAMQLKGLSKLCCHIADTLSPNTKEAERLKNTLFLTTETENISAGLNTLNQLNTEQQQLLLFDYDNKAFLDMQIIGRHLYGLLKVSHGDTLSMPAAFPLKNKVRKGEDFVALISYFPCSDYIEIPDSTFFLINNRRYSPENNRLLWTEKATEIGIQTYTVTLNIRFFTKPLYTVSKTFSYEVIP